MMNKIFEALRDLEESARLLGVTQAKKGFGVYTEDDARFERAMHESIAKHRRAALAEPTALSQFNDHGALDHLSPLERLRFFCAFAVHGQDWLDVEPFFVAIEAQQADLHALLHRALPALREYARANPKHYFGEAPQDPNGVHALLVDLGD